MFINMQDVSLSKNIKFPNVSNWVNRYSIVLTLGEETTRCFTKVIDMIQSGDLPAVKYATRHHDYVVFRCESIASKESIETMLKHALSI